MVGEALHFAEAAESHGDRSTAWELVGLQSGIAAAVAEARARAAEAAAAAEAFGEITVDRIVEALATLCGVTFPPAAQSRRARGRARALPMTGPASRGAPACPHCPRGVLTPGGVRGTLGQWRTQGSTSGSGGSTTAHHGKSPPPKPKPK